MLLDTGMNVFLWKGPTASIIEVKFAAKSAEVCMEENVYAINSNQQCHISRI